MAYFAIMAGLAFLATISFIFLRRPNLILTGKQRSSLAMSDYGTNKFLHDIGSVLTMLFSKKMRRLLPQLCWTGISISLYTGMLVPIIVGTLPEETEAQ